jgi:ATP-dependent DNA helicase RecG
MIEQAREDASTILELGLTEFPLLAKELASIQADAASEFIDKA